MKSEFESFHTDLIQVVRARADAQGGWTRGAFVDEVMSRLVAAEEVQDWLPCFFEGRSRRKALELDAYSIDEVELDGTLYVIVADFRDVDAIETLSTTDIRGATDKAVSFVAEARAGRLHETLEPSTPAADLARVVFDGFAALRCLRVVLVTNAAVGSRVKEFEERAIDGVTVVLDVWDLGRLQQISDSGGREPLDIDLLQLVPEGLPALPASIGATGYRSYLCVVPGSLLADIYRLHGSRLLEGNVRAFLSAKGKINRGLRRTLMDRPDRFFAFNNGITATASDVDVVERSGVSVLTRVRDLQIVNGGQTTASLYNTRQKDNANLDAVFVQMKLSVLPAEAAAEMIPEIARYANTQNKVSDADLFANHPFHRRVEELSQRVWAPPRSGHIQTHWFYERARAQYQTELSRRTPAKQKEFLVQNPKDQLLLKTDLAKYENAWALLPHVVSRGAQKNFVAFAEKIPALWDTRADDFNDRWFKQLIAKAVVFRAAERIVSKAEWYRSAYRANIVAYSVSRLVVLVREVMPGKVLDLDRLWGRQRLSAALEDQLLEIGEVVQEALTHPPATWTNVTEWAKKEECWKRVVAAPVRSVDGLDADVRAVEEERDESREARGQQRDDGSIGAVIEATRLAQSGFFKRAAVWPQLRTFVSEMDHRVLLAASQGGSTYVPNDRAAQRLVVLARKLKEEGLK